MPSFLFRSRRIGEDRITLAIELASQRFPELAISHRFTVRDVDAEVWVCCAPSLDHIERWGRASELAIGPVHGVDEQPAFRTHPGARQLPSR